MFISSIISAQIIGGMSSLWSWEMEMLRNWYKTLTIDSIINVEIIGYVFGVEIVYH